MNDSNAAAAVGEAVGCHLGEVDDLRAGEFVKGYAMGVLVVSVDGGERVTLVQGGLGPLTTKVVLDEARKAAEEG